MSLSLTKTKYKLVAVALSVALVACFVLHPIQARAASTDLDYIETTDSIETIKADLVALPAAALTIILGIIGFIAITYVVARNVSVPIEYSAGATFWDKCYELGQYCFDNATQALAPVFASVKQFVDDNPQLGTWGALSAFTALNLTKFFTAFSVWLSSTFVGDMTTTAAGLVETAKHTEVSWSEYAPLSTLSEDYAEYPYYTAMTSTLASLGIDASQTFGCYYTHKDYREPYYSYYGCCQIMPAAAGYTMLIFPTDNGDYTDSVSFRVMTVSGTNLVQGSASDHLIKYINVKYSYSSTRPGTEPSYADVEPNTAAIVSEAYPVGGTLGRQNLGYNGINYTPTLRDPVSKILNLAIVAGMHVAILNRSYSSGSIALDDADLDWITEVPTAADPPTTIPRDTILNPGESVDVDLAHISDTLGSISEQVDAIQDGLENGSTLELLKLLLSLTNADTLTQTAVATGTNPTIDTTPTYPIPGLDNVWKYVTYMFSTLGGWITFVGNCLQAVTVGDGGLSWIFYGAFIFIICGGFIGKLLL